MTRAKRFRVGTHTRQRRITKVLHKHISGFKQLMQGVLAFRAFQVELNGFFTPVEEREHGPTHTRQVARLIARRGFNLDNFSPQETQKHPAGRPHDHVADFDHAYPREGQKTCFHDSITSSLRPEYH